MVAIRKRQHPGDAASLYLYRIVAGKSIEESEFGI